MKASLQWRIGQGQRTISPMVSKNEMIKAMVLSILVALLTLIPYVASTSLAEPEGIFSGFLINPKDGFSYLAKMRQGYEGQWLFQLPYTIEPGEGTFIFIFFLFLGHLSKWFSVPFLVIYHSTRFLGSVCMFAMAFILVAKFLTRDHHRWWAFSLILLGGGLGWLALPYGLLASDLWIVESIPFLTAYANAHFSWATALLLILIILMVSKSESIGWSMWAACLISTLLAAIQPFSMIPLFIFLFLWLLLETRIEGGRREAKEETIIKKWPVYIAMIAGALPWFLYDFSITLHHPEIAAWNAQNQTPSPPVIEYILGFGAVLFISIVGLFKGSFKNAKTGRLLVIWVATQAILLYAPFGLQRRLSLGLYFPLVILAVMTLNKLIKNKKKLTFIFPALLLICIPSNLVVIGSGIAGVVQMDPFVVLDHEEVEAYQWLSSNSDPELIILAGPTAGNRIPAFTNLRVFYGHPFETVHAEEQRAFIAGAYASDDHGKRLRELQDLGVSYVFYGPEESEFGQPRWLEDLKLVFHSGEYSIYEIPIQ